MDTDVILRGWNKSGLLLPPLNGSEDRAWDMKEFNTDPEWHPLDANTNPSSLMAVTGLMPVVTTP